VEFGLTYTTLSARCVEGRLSVVVVSGKLPLQVLSSSEFDQWFRGIDVIRCSLKRHCIGPKAYEFFFHESA
jgi:hypothetical protein